MIQSLIKLFDRDLSKLKQEIEMYENEADLWRIEGEIANSAGNLCLHLVGNLNHFIGTNLGKTGYVRNRPIEFSDKNIAKNELIAKIEATRQMVNEVLPTISNDVLAQNHTQEFQGGNNTNEYFLVHLYGHLNYHLGQINYHRRLVASTK